MIVRREGDRLRLVMQTDHALLSGIMAAHWGNEAFRPPASPLRTAQAIGTHDDGWITWEAEPRVNRKTDRPYHFLEMPPEEILTIWYLGPKRAGERDPYAGLLLSRHGSYLVQMRLTHGEDPPEMQARLRQYLEDQETLRDRLTSRLLRNEPEAGAALVSGLDHSYRLLQLCDQLSLWFCIRPLEAAALENVPRSSMNDPLTLQALPLDERTLTLRPWPFDSDDIQLPIPLYDLPDRPFTTYNALQAAMRKAGRTLRAFRLRSSP